MYLEDFIAEHSEQAKGCLSFLADVSVVKNVLFC